MTRPRMRISTLMLFVVIVALTIALVAERRRSALLEVRAEAEKALYQSEVTRALYRERVAQDAVHFEAEKALNANVDQPPVGPNPR